MALKKPLPAKKKTVSKPAAVKKSIVAAKAKPKPAPKKSKVSAVKKSIVAAKPKPVAKKPVAKKVAPKLTMAKIKSAMAAKPIEKAPVTQDDKSTSAAQLALAAPVPPPSSSAASPTTASAATVSAAAPATVGPGGSGYAAMSLAAPSPAGNTPQMLASASDDISADDLNKLWDALAAKFDEYSNRISDKSIDGMIGKALADWQDFYYANTDKWPEDEVSKWTTIYNKTRETFEASVKPSVRAKDDGTVFNVVGKLADYKKYILYGAGALAGLALVAGASHGKRSRR